MADVVVTPVKKPASFKDVKFTAEEWAEANRIGPVNVSENEVGEVLRLSRGLYEMVKPPAEVQVKVDGMSIDDMPVETLKLMALSMGITIRKQMRGSDLRELVRRKVSEIEITDDEAEEVPEGE